MTLGLMKSSIERHFNSKHQGFVMKMKGLSADELAHFKVNKFNEFKIAFEKKNNLPDNHKIVNK